VEDNVILQCQKKLQENGLGFLGYFAAELGRNCNFPFFHKYLNINLNKMELSEVERTNMGAI